MSTFNAQSNFSIVWNTNLFCDNQDGKCNQYYYDNGKWIQIGTYNILTDYALDVIASNVDIYDLNNNIVINKLHDNKIPTNLSEINTSVNDNQSVQHISDFRTHIINITSSSNLESQIYENNTYDYFPQKVIDNDMSTCWSEGIDGYGIGESITLTFDNLYEISEVSLWNGLCTNDNLFYKNSRLGSIAIVLSNGDKYKDTCISEIKIS